MTEIGKRHDGVAADAKHVLEHDAGPARRLQRLRQDHIVEGVVRIVAEIGVGVTLDHREPLGDALVDPLPRELDAASIDPAGLAQEPQQLTVAAPDIEHLGAGRDHLGDHDEVDREPPGTRAASAMVRSRLRRVSMVIPAPARGRAPWRRLRESRGRSPRAPARRAGRRRAPCRRRSRRTRRGRRRH